MLSSLSENTYKQYDCAIRKWIHYCNLHKYDYTAVSVPIVIHFLTEIFDSGARYGTINSYKSALSLLFGNNTLNDDRVKRFMKGVFRLRPTRPRYDFTWNPSAVLDFLAQKWPNEDLSLETLSKKTLTLLALVTAHRMQTFNLIKLNNITVTDTEILIKIPDLIKTSNPNLLQPLLKLPFFHERPEICPGRCLQEYLNKTQNLRPNTCNSLFISYRKPHNKISTQRMSHWISDILVKSGIDTTVFKAHSTRHASTSTANRLGVSIDLIRKTAGWSNTSLTFARYYNKDVADHNNSHFARTILSSS